MDTVLQQHYGSLFAITDYVTQVHNIYLTASYAPTTKLRTFATVVFNKSTGEMDPVDMPDAEETLGADLEHMDYHFDEMHTYSALDYTLLQLSLGFDYRLSDMWKFTLDGEYAKLEDNTGYVYGVETGSYFTVRSGARLSF
jgi:hypothetical protein